MERKSILPKSFFSQYREVQPKCDKKDNYSKIEEVKWNTSIIKGKNKVVGSLPSNKKMI